MPIEMLYNIRCDMCNDVMTDGPYDIGFDYITLATLPRVQIQDWTIIDYKIICPRHKIQIFKGHAHHKKKKIVSVTWSCRDNLHAACSGIDCACDCHRKKEPKPDSFRAKPRGSPRDSL